MALIGDADPEDAWDESDPRPDKLAILVRLVLSIALEHATPGHSHVRVLARLSFARLAVDRLTLGAEVAEKPVLQALGQAFFNLTAAEGA